MRINVSNLVYVTGISTWGRKVGRRWDQLKRSDSSELLSVSGRRKRWSPNRKGGVTDEKENVNMLPWFISFDSITNSKIKADSDIATTVARNLIYCSFSTLKFSQVA